MKQRIMIGVCGGIAVLLLSIVPAHALSCAPAPAEVLELVASDGERATLVASGSSSVMLSRNREVELLDRVGP